MNPTRITRRGAVALAFGAAAALGGGGAARALSQEEAETFVSAVLDDLRALIEGGLGGPDGARKFLALVERRSAVDSVARFALGRAWRDLDEAQRGKYLEAFRTYVSRTYQKRFGEYSGEDIRVTGSLDAGDKGVIVKSVLSRPQGQPAAVEWLVSDRTGAPLLADISFEGVSLAVTLRETFGGMVEARNGDLDRFIADLAASEGA